MVRLGLMLDPRNNTRDEIMSLVQRADELGYSVLWLPESWGRDVFSLLTQAAVLTKRINLATGITTVWARTPATTAMTIASLDEVSGGRARLGLGITGEIVVRDWHGLKWEKPFRRTREYVDIIRLAVAGERVNYDGEIFHLRNFKLTFTPPRQRIPIYIGSFGPKNTRSAGGYADGWLAIEEKPEYFAELLNELVAGANAAGRNRSDLDVSFSLSSVVVAEDDQTRQRLRDEARRNFAFRLVGLGKFHGEQAVRQGFGERIEAMRRLWQAGDRAAATALVTDEMVDAQAIIGSAADAKKRIDQYRQNGADEVNIGFPSGTSFEDRMKTLEALAP